MNSGIFISYRQSDSRGVAGRIYDRLKATFGEDHVFIDADKIKGGSDIGQTIGEWLSKCGVLLAIIGPKWLTDQRLQDPEDWVRIEIASALCRGIPTVAVVVDDAGFPGKEQLPEELRGLVKKRGIEIRHHCFDPDFNELLQILVNVDKRMESGSLAAGRPSIPSPSGWLGILHEDLVDEDGVIIEVLPEGPAEDAGMENEDVILRVDDMEIQDGGDLSEALSRRHAGERIQIEYERDEEVAVTEVVLGELPEYVATLHSIGAGVEDILGHIDLDKLHEERARRGLTQEEVATQLGCSNSMVSRIENGDVQRDWYIRILLFYGCTLEELLEEQSLRRLNRRRGIGANG